MTSDFYWLIFLLISALFTVFFVMFSAKKYNADSAYKKTVCGFSFCIIGIIAAISLYIFIIHYLPFLFICISAGMIFTSFFVRSGFKDSLRKRQNELEKTEKLQKEIEELKNKPDFRLRGMRSLFKNSQRLLDDVAAEFAGEAGFEKDIIKLIGLSYKSLFDADGVVVLEADDFEDSLKVKTYLGDFPPPYPLPPDVPHKKERVITNFKYAEFKPGESVFGKTAISGKTYFIKKFTENGLVVQNGEKDFLQIGSMVFLPLISHGKVTGVAALSRNKNSQPFTEEDVLDMELFTLCAASVLNLVVTLRDVNELNSVDNVMNTASEIQQILLPKKLKKTAELDIESYFKQKRGICSDYYDVIQPNKDRVFVVLADVTGKSIQSVIVMVMIRAILYLITNTNKNAEDILEWLNKGITGKIAIDHFASLSLLSYTPKTKTLEFVAAGNQQMMLFRKGKKEVEIFQHKTDPIGVDSNSVYKSIKTPFESGDIAALYTDGIPEMLDKNGKQFGVNKLAKLAADNHKLELKKIIEKAKHELEEFGEGTAPHDDRTLLIVKPK